MTVIGFTRPLPKLEAAIREAEAMGFTVMAAPSMSISMGDDSEFSRMESALPGSIAIFGSTTAADICRERYGERFPEVFSGATVIAIGSATGGRLESYGLKVSGMPDEFSSYGLIEMLGGSIEGRRVVMVRSDSGTDVLTKGIPEAGAELIDIAVYKLVDAGMTPELEAMIDAISEKKMDWMAFTSPMSARTFFKHVADRLGDASIMVDNVKVAAIGRPTAEALVKLWRPADLVPEQATFRDLLEAIRLS